MSSPTPCTPCCSETQTVNVPGSTGASAITVTTANFIIPSVGGSVTVSVGDTSWMTEGKNLFVSDGGTTGNFEVSFINGATSVDLTFLGMVGDSLVGQTIVAGSIVAPGLGHYTVSSDLDLLTAFTDNTGGTKSDTIPVSLAKSTLIIPVSLVGITANSLQAAIAVPFAFTLNSVQFRVSKIASTSSKLATLTAQVNGSSVTGGAVALTTSNCGTYGATVAGSAITGGNTGTAGQTIGFVSSSVTAFSEGDGFMEFNVTNLDQTAWIAAVAFKLNQLRTALRHQ